MDKNKVAEFLGWYFGDGCLSINRKKQFFLTGDLTEEASFYEEIIIPTFNHLFSEFLPNEVKLRKYPSVGVCGIYIFNKDFVDFLITNFKLKGGKKLDVVLPTFETDDEKKSFLRGLFDTDGSIYFCKSNVKTNKPTFFNTYHHQPKIKVATISKNLMDYTFKLLLDLGFTPRRYSPRKQRPKENIMYSVVLDTKKNIEKWLELIGFRSYKHNSKIEIWKKYGFCTPHTSLQERELILRGNIDIYRYYIVSHSKEKNL